LKKRDLSPAFLLGFIRVVILNWSHGVLTVAILLRTVMPNMTELNIGHVYEPKSVRRVLRGDKHKASTDRRRFLPSEVIDL